jgi:hypothetical protein
MISTRKTMLTMTLKSRFWRDFSLQNVSNRFGRSFNFKRLSICKTTIVGAMSPSRGEYASCTASSGSSCSAPGLRRWRTYRLTSTSAEMMTGEFSGSIATPMAVRACLPTSCP